jgi:CheY-like chemotaxis protein
MRVGSVDPDRALTAPPWLGERPTVLVVEDDDDVASMLDDLLSDAGYRVYLAGDGQSGLAQAVRERPSVVLSDFMMPGMDGGQLVSKLHTNPRTRAIPVVLMSSSQHRVPGVPFVQKPFNVDDVLTLLARVRGDAAPLTRYGEG